MKRYGQNQYGDIVERDDGKFVLYEDVKIMEDIKDCSDEIIKSLSESNNKLQHKAALADKFLPKTADGKFVCECEYIYCHQGHKHQVTQFLGFCKSFFCNEGECLRRDGKSWRNSRGTKHKTSDCLATPRVEELPGTCGKTKTKLWMEIGVYEHTFHADNPTRHDETMCGISCQGISPQMVSEPASRINCPKCLLKCKNESLNYPPHEATKPEGGE